MAPGGSKRKRGERPSDSGESARPSPHRPNNLGLGQHDSDMRGDNRRRDQRGGRGGRPRNVERRNSGNVTARQPSNASQAPAPMSPPPARPTSSGKPSTPAPSTTPSTPVPTEPAALPTPITLPTKPNPTPFDYVLVTDERISSWNTGGRQAVITTARQSLLDEDTMDLSFAFQELIRAAIDGRLEGTDAGNCVKEILGDTEATSDFDPQTLFLDCLSIILELEEAAPTSGLQDMVANSGVSPALMRKLLDSKTLESLGIVHSTFSRLGVRQVTNLLYRQSNYNLLREETEGYSKLITELFTTSAEAPTAEGVRDAFERVKGLIGSFDLDVGRVLDVTLDIFGATIIKYNRFFVKFLRASSWWPRSYELGTTKWTRAGNGLPRWALPSSPGMHLSEEDEAEIASLRRERDAEFWDRARTYEKERKGGINVWFELGGRQKVDEATKKAYLERIGEQDGEISNDRDWIEKTGTLPPPGNRIAAQLLGFKLRFYASSTRDDSDKLPPNLIYLAALLIKIGFISLRDLYPHLYPSDEQMEKEVQPKLTKALEEKEAAKGGGPNALMLAGALTDDTLPPPVRSRETAAKPAAAAATADAATNASKDKHEPDDQKILLLKNLLIIGAIPESLFMLGQFPWLLKTCPELLDLIHRVLHHCLSKLFAETTVASPTTECLPKGIVEPDQSSASKGQMRRIQNPPSRPLRWPHPDTPSSSGDGKSYRFYWDEWADNIPTCQNIDDVFTLCDTFLNISGVQIGKDATLLSKLARIGSRSVAMDSSDANMARWQQLLTRLLVPALSFTESNTCVVNDVYDLLRNYPTATRYSIYAEWYEGPTSRVPAIKSAFTAARSETKSTMKRISKTNIPEMAKILAKTAYSCPGIVYKTALDQIESYNNLADVVVECAKYFTDLGYDVLVWCLLTSLGKDRDRKQAESALLTSKWLVSLAKFTGKVFKRYSIMNCVPVLQYVNHSIFKGEATDLIILEELISQMAGVVPDTDFNDKQLMAMTGGEHLRRQTLISLQDKRYESMKTSKRLVSALTDTRLAGQLLIAIAQHRQCMMYHVEEHEAHIKSLATMADDSQRVLFLYLDLLRSSLPVEKFDLLVPSINDLLLEFQLEPSMAFLISRASIRARLGTLLQLPTENGAIKVDANGDTAMTVDDDAAKVNGDKDATTEDVAMTGTEESEISKSPSPPATWRQMLEPVMEVVKKVQPESVWNTLSVEFYVFFWQLSLPDIRFPMGSYVAVNDKLSEEMKSLPNDRSLTAQRKEEVMKKLQATYEGNMAEVQHGSSIREQVQKQLSKERGRWFSKQAAASGSLNILILEKCLIPRMLLSPIDAEYCFAMIKWLHSSGTPHFSTFKLYDQLFNPNLLRNLIFTCTIREAENLGRFLKLVLGDLASWHKKKETYELQALGSNGKLPGFARLLDKDGKVKMSRDYEEFRRNLHAWHKKLNIALKQCLGQTEWMHIRNATTVLKCIVEHFPELNYMGQQFQATLIAINARETRPAKNADPNKEYRDDIALVAAALLPQLKRREKDWISPQAFANNLVRKPILNTHLLEALLTQNRVQPTEDTRIPARSNGPVKSQLKPTAPEFKPQSLVP